MLIDRKWRGLKPALHGALLGRDVAASTFGSGLVLESLTLGPVVDALGGACSPGVGAGCFACSRI
jgi:hypothetical protein